MGRRVRIKRRRTTMIMIRRSKNKYSDLFVNIQRFSFLVLTPVKAMKGNKANYKYVLFNLKREFLHQFYLLDLTGVRFKLNSKYMIEIPNIVRYIFINYQNQMLMLIPSPSLISSFSSFISFHLSFFSIFTISLVKDFSSFLPYFFKYLHFSFFLSLIYSS